MAASWTIIREKFSLSGLADLSKATGGVSEGWTFIEPSVAEVDKATKGGKGSDKDAMDALTRACIRDAEDNPVFGDGNSFTDLPTRAARELNRFVLDRAAPKDKEDEGEGKP